MKLENQLVCQELSMKMKELGFKQESLFYWQKWTQSDWKLNHYSDFNGINRNGQIEIDGLDIIRDIANDTDDACSAYSVVELGEMLPDSFMYLKDFYILESGKYLSDNSFYLNLNKRVGGIGELEMFKTFDSKTEADARAKMLIYLKDNNLI